MPNWFGWVFLPAIIIVAVIVLVLRDRRRQGVGRHRDDTQEAGPRSYRQRRSEKRIESIGKDGEHAVAKLLGRTIEGERYVLNDLLFMSQGQSVQVDHVLIDKSGILVVETKNYSGTIEGNESQIKWIQHFGYDTIHNEFYNPIRQNNSHIYHISQVLPIATAISGIVVFVNCYSLKVESSSVCTLWDLRGLLSQRTKNILHPEQMKLCYDVLTQQCAACPISKEEHIENIHKTLDNINHNICPRCGCTLVERKGKYGMFLGCYNYPRCTFTKKID